jgi:hypothetical protein
MDLPLSKAQRSTRDAPIWECPVLNDQASVDPVEELFSTTCGTSCAENIKLKLGRCFGRGGASHMYLLG